MTRNEANQRCKTHDATLSSVHSQEENEYLRTLIHRNQWTSINVNPWIGGTDEGEEGVFRWVNSNKEVVAMASQSVILNKAQKPFLSSYYLNCTIHDPMSHHIRWVDDDSRVDANGSFTKWDAGQPNGGESENCMWMASVDGTWGDYSCDETLTAVCAKPMPPNEGSADCTSGAGY